MSLFSAIERCRPGLIREHYLYFKLMSPTGGLAIAALGLIAGLSPNAVTLIGLATAVPIAVLNWNGQLLWACALLHAFYALDCADGILARATGRTSRAGAFLDDLAHTVVPPVFFLSLASWAMSQSLYRLTIVAASFAAAELAYRNVIQSMKALPSAVEAGLGTSSGPRAWILSSFHLPTVSVFVTATVWWREALTGYLLYATLATFLYFLYAAYRVSSQLSKHA